MEGRAAAESSPEVARGGKMDAHLTRGAGYILFVSALSLCQD